MGRWLEMLIINWYSTKREYLLPGRYVYVDEMWCEMTELNLVESF
jgi:hypothetical protein